MANSSMSGLVLAVLLLISTSFPICTASSYSKLRLSASEIAALEAAAPPPPPPDQPTTFFEVDRPHRAPPGSFGPCSTLLLSHSFAYTYTKPPVTVPYSPPACLAAMGGHASAISLAVLEWRATCRGVQYDRIFGVWLAGAELLRGSTAEPGGPTGVAWSVSKDVTKHASLLAARGASTLAVYLGNVVNEQYTGVFHVNLTLHLYFRHPGPPPPPHPGLGPADVILPVSRSLPLDDGLWFPITNEQDVGSASLAVPSNTYRAVLEVYLSYHSDDEFWYTNTPKNNGPFREVVALIDGELVGAVWPFPVIYTGGFQPFLWRPISGIGSFSLPSYDVELTPFLGKLLDGAQHEFQFKVTGAQSTWYVDANLHLWVDPIPGAATSARVVSYDAPPLDRTIAFRPEGPGDEFYYTTAFRRVAASGWVQTPSYGRLTATWTQRLSYENTNDIQGGGFQVNQTTDAYSGAHVADRAGVVYAQEAQQEFQLYMFRGVVDQSYDGSFTLGREVRLGFGEERVAAGRTGFWARSLKNVQDCEMDVDYDEDGSVVDVDWGTQQTYRYEATDACYFRNVTSSGYDLVSDHVDEACVKGSSAASGGVDDKLAKDAPARLSS